MTVQVHWMEGREMVVDYHSNGVVVAEVVDVPLLRDLLAEDPHSWVRQQTGSYG